MRTISIKIFSILTFLIVSTSVFAGNILSKGKITNSISYNSNKDGNIKEYGLIKFNTSLGVFNNMQLDISLNSNLLHISNKNKAIISTNISSIAFSTLLFSNKNYKTSINIITPINFSILKEKEELKKIKEIITIDKKIKYNKSCIIEKIIFNNAHNYTFNNGISLTAFHKNFINIGILNKNSKIKITVPIVLSFPITTGLSGKIATNLGSWENINNKHEFTSILSKIPTNLGLSYIINNSISINAGINIVTNIKTKIENKLEFGLGFSYKENIF